MLRCSSGHRARPANAPRTPISSFPVRASSWTRHPARHSSVPVDVTAASSPERAGADGGHRVTHRGGRRARRPPRPGGHGPTGTRRPATTATAGPSGGVESGLSGASPGGTAACGAVDQQSYLLDPRQSRRASSATARSAPAGKSAKSAGWASTGRPSLPDPPRWRCRSGTRPAGRAVPAAEDNQSVGERNCARVAVVGSAGRSVSSNTGSGTSMSPVAEIA